MTQAKPRNCSPYLQRRKRSLAEACLELDGRHAQRPKCCATCALADLCLRAARGRALPPPLPQTSAGASDALAHHRPELGDRIPARRRAA